MVIALTCFQFNTTYWVKAATKNIAKKIKNLQGPIPGNDQ